MKFPENYDYYAED